MRPFVMTPQNTFHGMVTGQEGKTRDEMLKNGRPLEPDYHVSPTLTRSMWVSAGRYNLRLDVIFVMGADDRVQRVRFRSPFITATTERGWLEVTPTVEYRRLFRAA